MQGSAIDPHEVGRWMRAERQRRRLTQHALGTLIYQHQSEVSRLEHGHRMLSLETLGRVCGAFGIDPATAFAVLYGEAYNDG